MSTVVGLEQEGIRTQSINMRDRPDAAKKRNIRSNPTFIYSENGSEVSRRTGWQSAASLKRMVEGYWF